MSEDSTQFWHYLSGNSIKFYRLSPIRLCLCFPPASGASWQPNTTCASDPQSIDGRFYEPLFALQTHVTSPGCYLLLFSCQVMSSSSQPHGLQHARLPCPLPSLRVCPSSCPLNQWYHLAVSSSDTLFFFCLQSVPASSGSFPVSQLFASGGQSIGASASASAPPKSVQDWFPLRLTGLIS